MSERVMIVGTGQMAVMSARLLCDNHHEVTLLGRPDSIEQLRRTRQSPHLPGISLPSECKLTDDPSKAEADFVVLAIPTQAMRQAIEEISLACPAVSCTKGIELDTGLRPSEIAARRCTPVAVLSGPNIAVEVVARKPAGAVVACGDGDVCERIRNAFSTDYFRVYTNDDVVGVELAWAIKNVIAIAAGVIDGLQLGNNAKAALITRGIVEITRLGVALGARAETFVGLAGMGDLITTCISPEGRNRSVGEMIGRGMTCEQALASVGSVCEGVPTTKAVLQLAGKHGVDMPIASAICGVLFDGKDVRTAILELMTREPKPE